MQDKLKPCAHCGAEAQIYYTGFNENDKRYVECSNCDCPVNDTWSYRTDEAAINAWNTRAESAELLTLQERYNAQEKALRLAIAAIKDISSEINKPVIRWPFIKNVVKQALTQLKAKEA